MSQADKGAAMAFEDAAVARNTIFPKFIQLSVPALRHTLDF